MVNAIEIRTALNNCLENNFIEQINILLRLKTILVVLLKNKENKLEKAMEIILIGNAKENINLLNREIENHKTRIENNEISIKDYEKRLSALKKTLKETNVLKEIKKLPFVTKIVLSEGKIIITTINLVPRRVNLGKYEFEIGKDGYIKLFRVKGNIGCRAHIFANCEGYICYGGGELERTINSLKREGRIDLVLSATWELLKNFDINESSPYISWEDFVIDFRSSKRRRNNYDNE
jgi:flagellar biosynthesis chaperone FliJ